MIVFVSYKSYRLKLVVFSIKETTSISDAIDLILKIKNKNSY